jgi:glycosyltransferase involved in cell wall biosynthesis
MRIGILTQYYPPEMGAPQGRLSALAARLREHGHEVIVLTTLPNYPQGRIYDGYRGFFRREDGGDATILRAWIWPTKSPRTIRRIASYLSFVVTSIIVGALRLPRLDALITESPPLPLGVCGFLLSRIKRARWVFNVSDLWPGTAIAVGATGENILTDVAYKLEAFCYRKAWAVSCQSREIESSIKDRFPEVRTIFFPNGVDTSQFHPGLRSETVWEDLVGRGAGVLAVYAGLHGVCQGLDQVLEAAAKLQEENVRFVLVGDGPEKEALIGKAREQGLRNVTFVDPQPRDAIPALLASADIAVVPLSHRIPGAVPSKLYEAMASGVPIVLVAEGEAGDIVRSSGAGLAVSPGNIDGLAEALRRLALSSEERTRLREAGRASAVQRFDRRTSCELLIRALEES